MSLPVRGSDNGTSFMKGDIAQAKQDAVLFQIHSTVMQNGDQGNWISVSMSAMNYGPKNFKVGGV